MRFKVMIGVAIILLLVSGCALNLRESQEIKHGNLNTESLNYESKREQKERIEINEKPTKDYYQSDEEGIAKDGNESNIYVTEDDREISQLLAKRKDIKQFQVDTKGDRVVVSVLLNDYTNNIARIIENEILNIVSTKEIIVYIE